MSVDKNIILSKNLKNMMDFFKNAVPQSSRPEAVVNDSSSAVLYLSCSEFPLMNGVFYHSEMRESNIKKYFEETINFFANTKSSFIWWWMHPEEVPHSIKSELDKQGFNSLGNYDCLAVDLNSIDLKPDLNQIQVERVSTKDQYQDYLNILTEVFALNDSIKKDFQDMLQSYEQNGLFRHYLGYYEGIPVTTLTTYIENNVVGLYSGSTLAKFQKHGVCTAVGKFALSEARNDGCEWAVTQLMAPGMASGICKKLGFVNYGRLIPFMKTV